MSNVVRRDASATPTEHGSIGSYVTGFILSLLFTLVPYFMVVNKVFTGNVLLLTILAIAVIQMLIQIFFFLHLGRGPKPLYNIFFFAGTVVTVLVVVGGSVFIMNNLHHMVPGEAAKKLIEKEGIYQISGDKTGACRGVHANHRVKIENNRVTPVHIEAQLCDKLTFINEDNTVREMAFGSHPRHESYGGDTELPLRKNRSKTITLNQAGTYQFHDHLDPQVAGSFTVSE